MNTQIIDSLNIGMTNKFRVDLEKRVQTILDSTDLSKTNLSEVALDIFNSLDINCPEMLKDSYIGTIKEVLQSKVA